MPVVFERNYPSAAAALFDRGQPIEPRRHERHVSIEVQQIPERRGLFRRPVAVSSASISMGFPSQTPTRHFCYRRAISGGR
jgi:hypothetical protein